MFYRGGHARFRKPNTVLPRQAVGYDEKQFSRRNKTFDTRVRRTHRCAVTRGPFFRGPKRDGNDFMTYTCVYRVYRVLNFHFEYEYADCRLAEERPLRFLFEFVSHLSDLLRNKFITARRTSVHLFIPHLFISYVYTIPTQRVVAVMCSYRTHAAVRAVHCVCHSIPHRNDRRRDWPFLWTYNYSSFKFLF